MKSLVPLIILLHAALLFGCGSSEALHLPAANPPHEGPASESSPTQGAASTAPTEEEKEEDSGPFFVPTEKIPVDISVDFPVDI